MHEDNKSKAILAAFLANLGIAVSKFGAFIITGSSSLLAESIHSAADSSNQVLLFLGGSRAKQRPSREHPFGYGRVHFLYAFMVSIVLFSLGGAFAVYEGVSKIKDPSMLESPVVAFSVLAIAIVLEGFALRTALKEAKLFKPENQAWWQFLKTTKSVNHIVLALEDSAALVGLLIATVGVAFTLITGNPVWDGVASLMIGLLLIVVASILFIEVKSLLVGESMNRQAERLIIELSKKVKNIERVINLKTLYTGPDEVVIAMKVAVDKNSDAGTIVTAIDELEARIRQAFPVVNLIYIEPDTYKSKKEQKKVDSDIQALIND